MKAKTAAAEQVEAKLKTKKEKAKAPADKATKKVVEQAMPVDAAPTKATKEEAAVRAGLSQLPPVAPGSRRAVRRTSAMGCASLSSGGSPSARDHKRLHCDVPHLDPPSNL